MFEKSQRQKTDIISYKYFKGEHPISLSTVSLSVGAGALITHTHKISSAKNFRLLSALRPFMCDPIQYQSDLVRFYTGNSHTKF